jgi:hypothetical protein
MTKSKERVGLNFGHVRTAITKTYMTERQPLSTIL